jgi:signal transduction histidine kinase
VLIWLGVSSAINPLHRVTAEVKSRRADDLAPVAVAAVPEEVSPLIEALNALFKRVEAAFDNERRFTSDAAHELRTPLAGLKLQAQLALQATDNVTRKTALQHVITGADRATHMVQQLLTIARLAPETGLSGAVEFNLTEVASRVLADIDRYAHGKNVELKLDASNEIKVTGDPDAISIMIGNLVRNAVEYTPSGGTVELYVANSEGNTILSVGDSGPGIPRDERDKVFSRFYRQPGTPGPGCGLGLSIVKRIADLHHARIVLGESPYGGLQVDVYFSNTTPVTTN